MQVAADEHRLTIVYTHDPSDAKCRLIAYENLGSDTLCVVVRPGHPFATADQLKWGSLNEYPWVLPPLPSRVRQVIECRFDDADLDSPISVVESESCLTALQIVQRSDDIHSNTPFRKAGVVSAG